MKGLLKIPDVKDLSQVYRTFQNQTTAAAPKQLALWSQWSRFDPRLAEQWTAHCAKYWRSLPSAMLNQEFRLQSWPAVAGVLLTQSRDFHLKTRTEKKSFNLWLRSVLEGIQPASPPELFFIGTRSLGGNEAKLDACRSLKTYTDFGYLGRDILKNKSEAFIATTSISCAVRLNVLRQLMRDKNRFRVADYRAVLDGQVTVRQAEKDLQESPHLQAVGNTRGRFYTSKSRRQSAPLIRSTPAKK